MDEFDIKDLLEAVECIKEDKLDRVEIRIVDSSVGSVEGFLAYSDMVAALDADVRSKFHVYLLGRANFADVIIATTFPKANVIMSPYAFVSLERYVPYIKGTTEEAQLASAHVDTLREEICMRLAAASSLDLDEIEDMCSKGVVLSREEMLNYEFIGDY